jgi:hypothetical protein
VVLDRALIFLYKQMLGVELGDVGPLDRADRPKRLPTVLSREEVHRLFDAMSTGPNRPIAHLFYGSGLSMEAASGCPKPFASGSKNSTLEPAASTSGTAKAARTGRWCCPIASTACSGAT